MGFWKGFSSLEIDRFGGEVQDIAKQLGASFHHVHREANVMADALAKEGVLRSSILFDVWWFPFLCFLFSFEFCLSSVGFFA